MRSKGWKKTPTGYAKLFDGYLFEVTLVRRHNWWKLTHGPDVIAYCPNLTEADERAEALVTAPRPRRSRPQRYLRFRVIQGGKS